MAFMSTLTKLATTVGGLLTGGTVPAIIGIAEDVVKLIKDAKEVVSTDDVPALEALLADLEPKVLAHADATERRLRGEE